MRTKLSLLSIIALLAALVPFAVQATNPGDHACLDPLPQLAFDDRVVIDPDRAGGEPVAIVAQDGSISVSAHAGTTHVYKDPNALPGADDFLVGYSNQTLNWRSADGGQTWDYIGLAGLNSGPHSATSTGFSDPDYAIDQAGSIYNVEINLANNAVFRSDDDGQSYVFANPEVFPGDRPWLAANEPGEVFLYINLPKQLLRSRDAGVTWTPLGAPPIDAKPYTDPRNPDDGLIGPVGGDGIAISDDDGETWTTYRGADLGPSVDFFDVMAVDNAGNAYRVAAGGYGGPNDGDAGQGTITFNYFDRDLEEWGQTVEIDMPEVGDAFFPWIMAGDDGRVALVWYQNSADNPREFRIGAAYTLNGTGTDCDGDGDIDRDEGPIFSSAYASDVVHTGAVCLNGTACNANFPFENGDRRLGDFFSVAYDADGRIFIVSGDTTLPSPTGGPKPVSNPIFIGASDEVPLLLEQPMETRPTRCLSGTAGTPLCTR